MNDEIKAAVRRLEKKLYHPTYMLMGDRFEYYEVQDVDALIRAIRRTSETKTCDHSGAVLE